MATYLDAIVAHHRARAGADRRSRAELAEAAAAASAPRDFLGALAAPPGAVAVIAEIKRRSPSKGDLAPDLDPAGLAAAYRAGGAAALSVLTDAPHFGGGAADLVAARAATPLPVLRKDFTVAALDCYDARAMGADAVLLIAAALSDGELEELAGVAGVLGLAALVEVHDEAELDRALGIGARLVGVNQRDLHTFEVDTERALRVGAAIPSGVVRVAESGIRDHADLARLAQGGFDAVLVGERLVTAPDPGAALAALRGASAPAGSR
ncbi:MAG: indole-3-glycerol phosphate synthase TrpC [Actinomycetota bacterium]|nr:indole-3-glycerol phosphate synthase TrpC [Actinomycetota bacterium]